MSKNSLLLDWPAIEIELAKQQWEFNGYFDIPAIIQSLFIGTVFSLLPSGKYYMPFACSNLSPCPFCRGKGTTRKGKDCKVCNGLCSYEAKRDNDWWVANEAEAQKRGLRIESGEGCPTDLLVSRYIYVDYFTSDTEIEDISVLQFYVNFVSEANSVWQTNFNNGFDLNASRSAIIAQANDLVIECRIVDTSKQCNLFGIGYQRNFGIMLRVDYQGKTIKHLPCITNTVSALESAMTEIIEFCLLLVLPK